MVRISVDLPDEVAEALARAAAERQSTREAMLLEAARAFVAADDGFEAFVADRAAFDAWIAEGEAEAAAGRTIPAEEVFAELRQRIASAGPRRSE
jgi:predicted transcriptional regulator